MFGVKQVGELKSNYLYSSHPKNVQPTNPLVILQNYLN